MKSLESRLKMITGVSEFTWTGVWGQGEQEIPVKVFCSYQPVLEVLMMQLRADGPALAEITTCRLGSRETKKQSIQGLTLLHWPSVGRLMAKGSTRAAETIFAVELSGDGAIKRSEISGTNYLVKRTELEGLLTQGPRCLKTVAKKVEPALAQARGRRVPRGFV